MFGGDFAAILKFGDHFAGNGQFRSPFLKLGAFSQQGVDFVEEGNSHSPFCNSKVISQPYRSFEMRGTVLQNGTRVPRGCFAAAKIFAERGLRLRNDFVEASFRLQNLADLCFSPVLHSFLLQATFL